MSVVGFDFGNLNSVVAVARRRGIDVLQNEVGHRATPSYVAFSGKQRFVGNEAAAQAGTNLKNTVTNVKRFLGRSFTDPTLVREQPFIQYKLVEGPRRHLHIQVQYDDQATVLSPEQISGCFLTKLKVIAESGLEGLKVTDCVIGVPHWWTDAQRRALLDAAHIAGLNVLRLINEMTSVALNYGILRPLPKDSEQKVLFLDLGHSQMQACLVSFTEGKLNVLSYAYDPYLGGRDFDEILVQHFLKYIKEKYKMDVTTEPKAMLKLRKECERVKLHLSANSKVQFSVEYIMNDRDVSGMIDRAEFESVFQAALLQRLLKPIEQALSSANITKEQLHSIEVIGGSVRIPAVQKALNDYFGREMSKTCDADESVARGAALMCAMISPSFKVREFDVHDVSIYPIELQWGAVPAAGAEFKPDDSTVLFTANNAIPSVKLISFTDRAEPFQLVARYSDPSNLPNSTDPIIGRFIVSGMPAKQEGKKIPKIKVRVKINIHGIVQVANAQLLEEIEEDEPAAAAPAAAAPSGDAKMEDAAQPKDESKMDTSADAPAASDPAASPTAAADASKKKVKVNRHDLKVDCQYVGGCDQSTLNSYFEREAQMANQDRVIFETNQARNDLESYILDMRNRLSSDLQTFIKPADRDAFNAQLQAQEDWLYGDGSEAQKSEYKKKLEELKKLGDPIVHRKDEAHNRDTFVAQLKSAIGHYSQWAATKDAKHEHITDEERKKVVDECNSADQWLASALSQQDRLAPHDHPALTCEQLRQKRTALDQACNPIMHKPKPEPKKEEPKKEEKKAEEKKSDEKKPEQPKADAEQPKADDSKPMEQ